MGDVVCHRGSVICIRNHEELHETEQEMESGRQRRNPPMGNCSLLYTLLCLYCGYLSVCAVADLDDPADVFFESDAGRSEDRNGFQRTCRNSDLHESDSGSVYAMDRYSPGTGQQRQIRILDTASDLENTWRLRKILI